MCGIAGYLDPAGFREPEAEGVLIAMRDQLAHRGPDDAGNWLDGSAGAALAHRRLSILDLSVTGHQPMVSASGRYVIVFNGEIYNHTALREQAEAAGYSAWRGHSDTESLLAAVELWGLEGALQRSVGMFALALWDRQTRALSLARDRMGEKPLFYGWQKGVLLFASELKPLLAHPAFERRINRDVLPLYLRKGYIPAPHCIWKGIQKLQPGTVVCFPAEASGLQPLPQPYWSVEAAIRQGLDDPFSGSDEDAVDCLERGILQSIEGQRIADVPLGAFLSGGIDSSTVTALLQARSSRPVKTFTIGFQEDAYNEAKYAKAVAQHLGTDHVELYVTSAQAREVVPHLSSMYDEPFGDSSAIPTHLVSKLARQEVTVSLSGDGGDELFGGYSRYFSQSAMAVWQKGRKLPRSLRGPLGAVLRSPLPAVLDHVMAMARGAAGASFRKSVAAKSMLAGQLLGDETLQDYYQTFTSQWWPEKLMGPDAVALSYGIDQKTLECIPQHVQGMMAIDSVSYLPDDILVKVDRAAMAVGLESRVPLLDHRLFELAWRIPYQMKVRDGQGKWLLRQVLYRYLPKELIERPKMGFGVPVDDWMRGPMKDWAESLLDAGRLREEGFFDPAPIRARWREHQDGRNNWRDSLWLILMWQAWLEEYL